VDSVAFLEILARFVRPLASAGRLTSRVANFHRPTEPAVPFFLALVVICSSTGLAAAPQDPSGSPVSLERIREGLAKTPARPSTFDMPVEAPVATFRTSVEQRVYVLTLEEWIHKEFALTSLQRQSAEWASKCCGLSLAPLLKGVKRALQGRKVRKTREEIARELAELEATKKKPGQP